MKLAQFATALAMCICVAGCGGEQLGGNPMTEEPVTQSSTEESSTPAHEYVGKWTADEKGDPSLELTEDGKVQGFDGCNPFFTSYSVNANGEAVLETFTLSGRACPGMQPWLDKARSLTVDGDTMTVLDVNGDVLGLLQRQT